jgi:hypothetical protein
MSKRYEVAKRVVESGTAEKLDGVLFDTFTSGALVKLYEALSEGARVKFDSVPLARLVSLAFGNK